MEAPMERRVQWRRESAGVARIKTTSRCHPRLPRGEGAGRAVFVRSPRFSAPITRISERPSEAATPPDSTTI